jgi:4-diphosphocytidyl-2-C-methyl-D-erythritol kinase
MKRTVTELAPAKLNLTLRIVGRRRDGYHLIDSVIVPITLYDRVRVSMAPRTRGVRIKTTVDGATAGVPRGQRNLADQSARAFLGATGQGADISLHIEKAIPPAAGLGGGSSDAAAVLRALWHLSRRGFPRQRLSELALGLGADVPFFLQCRPARVRGIGEIIRPYRGRIPQWFVVAVPRRGVSTAIAYARVQLTKTQGISRLSPFRYTVSDPANDLEEAVLPVRPDIGRLKEYLLDAGAKMTLMSGSGSAVFGVFASQRRATAAASRLPRSVRAFTVKSLAVPAAALRRAGR